MTNTANLNYLIGKDVIFQENIEEKESYPEDGMRGRIVAIEGEDTDSDDKKEHVYKVTFDYSDYDEFNKRFESSNYYGMDNIPNKTARQAGHYSLQEVIYFGNPDIWPWDQYFTLLDDSQKKLAEEFKESGEPDYVAWLEKKVIR